MNAPLIAVLAAALPALAGPPGAEAARAALGGDQSFVEERPGAVDPRPWWQGFGDPALTALMTEALDANASVQVARLTASVAQLSRWAVGSALLPAVSFDVGASASPTDALGFQFGGFGGPSSVDVLVGMETLQDINGDGIPDIALDPAYVSVDVPQEDLPTLTWNGSALFNAAWMVDFWGSRLQDHKAALYDLKTARGNLDTARMTTTVLVANAWYDLIFTKARNRVVSEQVETNRQLLELVQLRYEGGSATGLEVLQQRQQLAATEALVPSTTQGVDRALMRLSVLLGRSSKALLDDLTAGDELPAVPTAPAIGTPADLLRNRPDLAAAMAAADAAFYDRRSADRAFLPSLGLSANVGWQYFRQDELSSTDIYGIGAQASVPLFNGGRLLATSKAGRAAEQAALISLENSVRIAVQEVDDALLFERQSTAELAAREAQVEAAQAAYDNALDRYLEGLVDLTTMLQTLTALQNAELSLLQSQRNAISARIALHDALGGAWARSEVTR